MHKHLESFILKPEKLRSYVYKEDLTLIAEGVEANPNSLAGETENSLSRVEALISEPDK